MPTYLGQAQPLWLTNLITWTDSVRGQVQVMLAQAGLPYTRSHIHKALWELNQRVRERDFEASHEPTSSLVEDIEAHIAMARGNPEILEWMRRTHQLATDSSALSGVVREHVLLLLLDEPE